ncbi:MAG: hypothetical protein HWE39_00135 [Oceanospirillaceae bacterium]|nr:hypothetical protein [Oceanospirillaceae bacterium]
MILLLSQLVLLGSALGSTALLYRKSQGDGAATTLGVMSLGALALALSMLGRLLLSSSGPDQQTLRLMLENLAFYAGLPLFALAVAARGFRLDWSRATWGRWLLGCFALFELFRRFGTGEQYSQVLALLICLALLAGVIRGERGRSQLLALAGTLVAAVALLLFGPSTLLPAWRQETLHLLALALCLPLISLGISARRT